MTANTAQQHHSHSPDPLPATFATRGIRVSIMFVFALGVPLVIFERRPVFVTIAVSALSILYLVCVSRPWPEIASFTAERWQDVEDMYQLQWKTRGSLLGVRMYPPSGVPYPSWPGNDGTVIAIDPGQSVTLVARSRWTPWISRVAVIRRPASGGAA